MLSPLLDELASAAPLRAPIDRPSAAVALVLVGEPDRLLLIQRAEREGDPWSGHLALPGGRFSATDPDLLHTAIRETFEETGVALRPAWCRAELDDLVPTTPTLPPIVVRPFVFAPPAAATPVASAEVARAMWLPLAQLAVDGVYAPRSMVVSGIARQVSGYALTEGFLWGITERIISPVVHRWKALQRA